MFHIFIIKIKKNCKSTKKIVEYSKDQGTHINVPGPGTYQHEDTLGKTGWKVGLGKGNKDAYRSIKSKNDFIPGPGTYDLKTEMKSNGLYYTSNFKNVQSLPFKPTKRFKEIVSIVPGPGNYDTNTNTLVHPDIKSEQAKSGFGKSMRKQIEINEIKLNPGPGFYNIPSTFGEIQK